MDLPHICSSLLFDAYVEPRGYFADCIGCLWKVYISCSYILFAIATQGAINLFNSSVLIINLKIVSFTQFDVLTRFSLRILHSSILSGSSFILYQFTEGPSGYFVFNEFIIFSCIHYLCFLQIISLIEMERIVLTVLRFN